jgi:5'-AMP-activated protein kinase catalytic alpha subunit
MFKSNIVRSKHLISNYQIRKVIGTGTFGKVREAIHVPTNSKVAIKIL